MSDLGQRAPKPERKRLPSSFSTNLAQIAVSATDETPATGSDATLQAAAAAPAEQVQTPPTAPRTKKPAKSAPRRPAADQKTLDTSSAATVGVTVRLGESLHKRLDAHKAEVSLSYPIIIMTAVQSSYPRLHELISSHQTPLGIDEGAPNLFGLPTAMTRRSSSAAEPKHSLPFKISPERREVLDGLVRDTGAASLNELIVVSLDDYLPAAV